MATSKPREFAERIIEHFGLSGFFGGSYGSELDGTRADKADLIAYVLEKERLDHAHTVMVGDRAYDVIGAHRTSIPCLGVTYGYGSEEELLSAGADGICPEPVMLATSLRTLLNASRVPFGVGKDEDLHFGERQRGASRQTSGPDLGRAPGCVP